MSEVTQYEGILTYVDAAGNETEMYPEVKTDESLTVSGKPADAKAVGDKIKEAMENAGGKAINLTQEEYDALPEEEKKNGIYVTPGGAELTAKNLFYDGSVTGLGNNVQDAVDNVNKKVDEQNKKLEVKNVPFANDIVPVLTSDSSNGNAAASSVYGAGYEAYRAFDNDENTFWSSTNGVANPYIQYDFANNILQTVDSFSLKTRLDAASYMPTNITFLYNNNGEWLEAGVFEPTQDLTEQTFVLSTSVTSHSFRILINGTGNYAFSKVQFYTHCEKNVDFYFDYKDGKYGYNTDPSRGADTFVPFKKTNFIMTDEVISKSISSHSWKRNFYNYILEFEAGSYDTFIATASITMNKLAFLSVSYYDGDEWIELGQSVIDDPNNMACRVGITDAKYEIPLTATKVKLALCETYGGGSFTVGKCALFNSENSKVSFVETTGE